MQERFSHCPQTARDAGTTSLKPLAFEGPQCHVGVTGELVALEVPFSLGVLCLHLPLPQSPLHPPPPCPMPVPKLEGVWGAELAWAGAPETPQRLSAIPKPFLTPQCLASAVALGVSPDPPSGPPSGPRRQRTGAQERKEARPCSASPPPSPLGPKGPPGRRQKQLLLPPLRNPMSAHSDTHQYTHPIPGSQPAP